MNPDKIAASFLCCGSITLTSDIFYLKICGDPNMRIAVSAAFIEGTPFFLSRIPERLRRLLCEGRAPAFPDCEMNTYAN